MAHRYWGSNRGQTQTDVVEASSSPTKNVEVNVDLSANMSREEVIIKLNEIMNVILQDKWPPA